MLRRGSDASLKSAGKISLHRKSSLPVVNVHFVKSSPNVQCLEASDEWSILVEPQSLATNGMDCCDGLLISSTSLPEINARRFSSQSGLSKTSQSGHACSEPEVVTIPGNSLPNLSTSDQENLLLSDLEKLVPFRPGNVLPTDSSQDKRIDGEMELELPFESPTPDEQLDFNDKGKWKGRQHRRHTCPRF